MFSKIYSLCAHKAVVLSARKKLYHISISVEVQNALVSKKPIVALESTIISHGMPYPRNMEVAKEVESLIRQNGVTPATIAIIDGVIKVGLSEDMDFLKLAKGPSVVRKASTRDIGFVCTKRLTASTTVASTMKIASLVGISVFATGGIGGVHRGAETTLDISADLLELSRSPVTVVCAGVKSILDIDKTLEYLETHGVPVITIGATEFPAFFTNNSGIPSPLVVDNVSEISSIMAVNRLVGHPAGLVVAVPNPFPANSDKIQYAIDFAILKASEEGVFGALITPFVLQQVEKLTGGESLESNVSLILNNAKVACDIAKDVSRLQQQQQVSTHRLLVPPPPVVDKEDDVATGSGSIHITTAQDEGGLCSQRKDAEVDSNTCRIPSVRGDGGRVLVVGGAVIDMVSDGQYYTIHDVMVCYVMLCYVMLCYVMLCYVMLCYAMLCYAMVSYVML